MIRFRRYRRTDNRGKVTHNVGWALQIWRFVVRLNRQENYKAIAIEYGKHHIV